MTLVRRAAAWLAVAVVLAAATSAAPAQSATQATVVGRVVDRDGAALPGVRVTALSAKAGMQAAETLSGPEGEFRLISLPPANDYRLIAELPGFAKVEIGPMDLDPGRATVQNITLIPSSEATETITIVGKGNLVDLTTVKTATVFNSEFIEGLPILGRRYQDILTLAPGVTDVDGDGNPNVNGSRATGFQTRVDGINTSDPLTGLYGQNLNLDAIAKIEVITTGAPAEFSQAQGGFANILTKSGGNDFEGNIKVFVRTHELDGDGANNNDVGQRQRSRDTDGFRDFRPFVNLGGPIAHDQAWYFLSLQYIHTETPVDVLDGRVQRNTQGWNNFLKFTWQPYAAHRLTLSGNWDPRQFTGLNLKTGVSPESDFKLETGGLNVTAGWTYNISPSLLLETRIARLDTENEIHPQTSPGPCELVQVGEAFLCDPFAPDIYTIDIVTGKTTGPYFENLQDERSRDTLRADFSVYTEGFGGTHNLKTGFEISREGFERSVRHDRVRVVDVDVQPPPSPFIRNPPDPEPTDISGMVQIQDSFPNKFGGRGCIPVTSGAFDPACGFNQQSTDVPPLEAEKDNIGFYIQDSFKPAPNVAVNLGLRYDREEASSDGWTPFEPAAEADRFLDLVLLGSGRTMEQVSFDPVTGGTKTFGQVLLELAQDPQVQFDVNGDGKDPGHCTTFGLDRYNNSLVTGFEINENGTYTMVGDPGFDQKDGVFDNFFLFVDGGGAAVCSGGPRAGESCQTLEDCPTDPPGPFHFACLQAPDGVARFDPGLAGTVVIGAGQYGDTVNQDLVFFDPAAGYPDDDVGENPNCDRQNLDALAVYRSYTRHQLDLVRGPVDFPANVADFDNGCDAPFVLPGVCREAEHFEIVNDNFAPRLSFSWDPWSDNRTKVFGSWSRFYDKLFLATLTPELGPDPRTSVFVFDNIQSFNLALLGGVSDLVQTGRFSTTQVDRDMKTPFVDEFTLGFERELAPEWVLGVTYINREGRDQLQDVDQNHFTQDANGDGILDDVFGRIRRGDPDTGGDGQPIASVIRVSDDQPDLYGFSPLFNQVLRVGNFNVSEYESLQVVLTRRLSRRWQMTTSYVWSEARGAAESFDQALGNDPGTVEEEFGFLSFDQTHVFKASGVAYLSRGQSLGASIQWASGLPYSQVRVRGSGDIYDSFTLRTTFPSEQRNDQRNQSRWNMDVSYRKDFNAGPNRISLGVEIQDLLNTDDLRIHSFDATRSLALDSEREFGRRWQLSAEFHF